jgi:porphobilinogen synthase
MRRLRRSEGLRRMARETQLLRDDLIFPLFAVEGSGRREAVASMPGVFRHSVDVLANEVKEVRDLGIPAVLLFGVPDWKDAHGSRADHAAGVVQRAVEAIKRSEPELVVITDVCLCEYTDHGHCGILAGESVDNDPTLERLAATAVSHARAGADIVAPSDMMDGRVGAIRRALDAAGFESVAILSYAAKFASAFYGPFREAAESTPRFGDRRSYQMDPGNAREALREMELDLAEGADALMVKPALAYLDLVAAARARFGVPIAAYHVSGEYAMVEAAAEKGWIDGVRAMEESLLGIKRAGADWIVSYAAKKLAARLPR